MSSRARLHTPLLVLAGLLACLPSLAQSRNRILAPIDRRQTVVRSGDRHPLARPEFEVGVAPSEMRMERMMLVLAPGPEQQQALEELLAAQHDPESPAYQRWLTPEEFGERFGASASDIDQVTNWLRDSGFDVEPPSAERRYLLFSGTAGQVADAFGAEIRTYRVNGRLHYANAVEPRIPAALADVVAGVVSLHDFHSRPLNAGIAPADDFAPEYTASSTRHYLAPGDFAKIYNSAPLVASAIDGAGQSVAIIGRTNIVRNDATRFRSTFGLPANDPVIVLNGVDPGVVSADEQGEAMLDIEWAGAAAPKATIQFVVSKTTTTDGVALSAQYAVSRNLAPIVSVSFGLCEAAMGASGNQFWNGLWQQAAAQGMTVLVASGDSGAAGCDPAGASLAVSPKGVNGLCSSPYSTCVGGTQFDDVASPSTYWKGGNSVDLSSALSYIPEVVWNTSGAVSGGSGLWATGGGLSILYAKPSWQTGAWVPSAATMRAVPDISLAGSSHTPYLIYMNGGLYGASGTSASAPALAGVLALAAQRIGGRLGNVNPSLYSFASRQASGGAAVFHDVVSGNNSAPGMTGFSAAAGFDYATGLGSVDASLLVNNWTGGAAVTPSFSLSATPASISVGTGAAASTTLQVTPSGGFTSTVTLSASGAPSGVTTGFSPSSLAASGSSYLTVLASSFATVGSGNIRVTATGGGVTKTLDVPITVTSACTYTLNPTSASIAYGASANSLQVTAGAGCFWSAAPSASWIKVTSGASGAGNGVVTWTADPNAATAVRSGSLTVGGKSLLVTQAAAPFALASTSASVAAGGSTGAVSLTSSTGGAWTAVSTASWITITSAASGSGSAAIAYSVAANPTTAARSGTLVIAGLIFTVTQAASACQYTVTPTSQSAPAAGGAYSVQVTASPGGCTWTATAGSAFLSISAGASGAGVGAVNYMVAANSAAARSGSLTVAGQTVTVSQAAGASSLAFSLSPGAATATAMGGKGSVSVVAAPGQAWTAVSQVPWISVDSGASGNGSGTVVYTVYANMVSTPRTGSILIGGVPFTISQALGGCTYSVGASKVGTTATGYSLTIPVTTQTGCVWTASSGAAWVTLTTAPSTSGSGKAIFAVPVNNTGAPRSTTVLVAGSSITVSQR
jgi:hypothetical protein